jgi:O-acetyl-ADP-ribose deacetylase (regulator of RNase III)
MRDMRLQIIEGDITTLAVDAIVNAANSSLQGGSGVDGAIHRAAGAGLTEECRQLGGCPPGEARLTGGYQLPARYVIHTVGPIWRGGGQGEVETLAQCYRNSLALAVEHGLRTIAFPSISTGAYGFPIRRASRIALRAILGILDYNAMLESVLCVCYSRADYDEYTAARAAVDPRV